MNASVHLLLVAKAPVPGQAKTRLGIDLGDDAAAALAAAALLDTITACEAATAPGARLIALMGDLTHAARGGEISRRLRHWHRVDQQGDTFADRLVHAHASAAHIWGKNALVVQIGMDTPQVRDHDLTVIAAAAMSGGRTGCALGPAADGGWWGLATMQAGYAEALSGVPMSQDDTGELTGRALRAAGAALTTVHALRDVDTLDDAVAVATEHPTLGFSQTFLAAYAPGVSTPVNAP